MSRFSPKNIFHLEIHEAKSFSFKIILKCLLKELIKFNCSLFTENSVLLVEKKTLLSLN